MTFALFLLYVVLSYIYPGEVVPALAPYRLTYWVGMAGLAVAIPSLLGRTGGPVANVQLWMLLVLTGVMGLSLMVAERWFGAPVTALQRFGPSLTMFVLATCSITSLVRLRITAGFIIGLTLILMLQGAAAYHLGYHTRLFLMNQPIQEDDSSLSGDDGRLGNALFDVTADDTDDYEQSPSVPRIRSLGLMNDPNDLAMGMIVALGLIGGTWKPRLRPRHVLLGAAAIGLAYGIYLTGSRGGAVAMVVVTWRFAASRLGRVPAFVVLVLLAAGTMALDFGGRSFSVAADESASGRLDAWIEGLEMLKAQPILGVGFGQFLDHHTLTAHNSLVLCFAETGLLGSFFWVGLLVVTVLELQGLKTMPGNEPFEHVARQWAEGLQLSLIGFMTAACFLSRTFVPMLYLIIGLSAALAAIARNANRPVPLPPLPVLGTLVLACEIGGIGLVYTMAKLHVA